MPKINPVIERIRAHRAGLETQIEAAKANLAALQAEAANLDKLMARPPPTAAPAKREPRATRKVPVREHERKIGAADPGAQLPIAGAGEAEGG